MTGKRDVSSEVETKNGKGNPSGWSYYELWHNNKQIGCMNCGFVEIKHPDYFHTEIKEPKAGGGTLTRVTIWKKQIELKAD